MELDKERLKSEYLLESAQKTLSAGTIVAWLSIPVVLGFTFQDFFLLNLYNVWVWRLACLLPFIGFLIYRYFFSRDYPRLALILNVLNITGILTMMGGIAVVVLADPASSLLNQYGVSAGLITAIFVCLIMAAGARRSLMYLIPASLIITTLALILISGSFPATALGFLSNSYLVGILVMVFARIQEKREQRAFYLRKKIEIRENQLALKTDELERLNQDLESFSYTVSHDLRGPIRNMLGLSTIFKRKASGEERQEMVEMADAILINAQKMNRLVEDILAFSRAGKAPLKTEKLDMTGLFQEVYEELRPAEASREIQFELQPLAEAAGDPTLIRQVVVNLIANALKYTRHSSHTEIRVRGYEENPESYIYIVSDNGAGFDDIQKDKLFTAFERLHDDAEFEGNGVGLAFAQKILERHHGKIWAEGKPGEGATFYFTLPMQSSN